MLGAFSVLFFLIVCSAIVSSWHWFFDFAGQFLLPARTGLVIIAVAIAALMIRGEKRLIRAATIGVCMAGFALTFIPLTSPARQTGLQADQGFSVWQHNIWVRNRSYPAAVAAMKAADTDFVALVEAHPEDIDRFVPELQERWPYIATGRTPPAVYARTWLFSKYEILESEVFHPRHSPAMLRARVRTPSGDLTFIVAHFTRPWPFDDPDAQWDQFAGLVPLLADTTGPVVLLGDFNSTAWGRLSQRLQSDYEFSLVSNPAAGTWPGHMPPMLFRGGLSWPSFLAIPIDLTFCRGGAVCGDHKVGKRLGSDHRSVQFSVMIEDQGD